MEDCESGEDGNSDIEDDEMVNILLLSKIV